MSKFIPISWSKIPVIFFLKLLLVRFDFVSIFCGSFLDLVAAFSLKKFLNSFGCFNVYSVDSNLCEIDYRYYFQLNTTIEKLESMFNILFLGSSIRLEAPLLNSRLRKVYLASNAFNAYSIGLSLFNTTYPICNLGILFQIYYVCFKVNY